MAVWRSHPVTGQPIYPPSEVDVEHRLRLPATDCPPIAGRPSAGAVPYASCTLGFAAPS
jgi:hypothetical protein